MACHTRIANHHFAYSAPLKIFQKPPGAVFIRRFAQPARSHANLLVHLSAIVQTDNENQRIFARLKAVVR
jgi:hypothetical protein